VFHVFAAFDFLKWRIYFGAELNFGSVVGGSRVAVAEKFAARRCGVGVGERQSGTKRVYFLAIVGQSAARIARRFCDQQQRPTGYIKALSFLGSGQKRPASV